MTKVIYTMSMSLDGFVRASGNTPDEPLGQGGERLHDWAMGDDPANRRFLEQSVGASGAVVTGRANYEDSIRWWGADGPTGAVRLPVIVVTHRPAPAASPDNGVYRFINGIEVALAAARTLAGGKNVTIMGGPDIGMQALRAGLVDEVAVSVAPVLFGSGLRMFAELPAHIRLERIGVTDTKDAVHIGYRILQ